MEVFTIVLFASIAAVVIPLIQLLLVWYRGKSESDIYTIRFQNEDGGTIEISSDNVDDVAIEKIVGLISEQNV